jgi:hypothetical protein
MLVGDGSIPHKKHFIGMFLEMRVGIQEIFKPTILNFPLVIPL